MPDSYEDLWLEWRNGRISFIRDYRYVRYVVADAELAPDTKPAGDGAAHRQRPPRGVSWRRRSG